MIIFNKSPVTATTSIYIDEALSRKTSGDGMFTRKCSKWIQMRTGIPHVLLTSSCSHALEMAAWLCDINEGDEVIMSSYTFSSTANAFVGRGARVVFVDIRPDTMNIDESLIEDAITKKTRAIVPMHYAGVACDMDAINYIAKIHGLLVVEDAAHGVMATYKGIALGALSDYGCYSFHETKNFSMGEGGALLVRDESRFERAEIIREKGTDRSRFLKGEVDKYSWVEWGSSYLPSEINTAYLWSQLEVADEINSARLTIWNHYYEALKPLAYEGFLDLPYIPDECSHNAHLFYIKASDISIQANLLKYLKERGIYAIFHYIPLHSSKAGHKFGAFHGEDRYTTYESSRLIRLPLYYGLGEKDADEVVACIYDFFNEVRSGELQ